MLGLKEAPLTEVVISTGARSHPQDFRVDTAWKVKNFQTNPRLARFINHLRIFAANKISSNGHPSTELSNTSAMRQPATEPLTGLQARRIGCGREKQCPYCVSIMIRLTQDKFAPGG